MDDCLDYVLQEIALDGDVGTDLERVWAFASAFFQAEGRHIAMDDAMKRFLWSGLLDRQCIVAQAGDVQDGRSPGAVEGNLDAVLQQGDKNLRVKATEETQWLTLTGHPKDSTIAKSQFSLLSHISGHRATGISQPALTRESKQDMRSVPKRIKDLVSMGIICSFPVVFDRCKTVWLVHRNFLDTYLEQTQSDLIGARSGKLNMHALKRAISEQLSKSKNQIRPVTDLLRSLKLGEEKDTWISKRFRALLRHLDRDGYVQLVLYRKENASSNTKCVKLLKPIPDSASDPFSDEDDGDTDQGAQSASESEDEIHEHQTELDGAADLDLASMQLADSSRFDGDTWLSRSDTVDMHIVKILGRDGTAGRSGRVIRRATLGNGWVRPFDEIMRSLTVKAAGNSQSSSLRAYELQGRLDADGKLSHYVYSAKPLATISQSDTDNLGEMLLPRLQFRPALGLSQQPPVLTDKSILDAVPQMARETLTRFFGQEPQAAGTLHVNPSAEALHDQDKARLLSDTHSQLSPVERRCALILQALATHGGYISKGIELTTAFNQENVSRYNADYTVDRKTILRALDILLAKRAVKCITFHGPMPRASRKAEGQASGEITNDNTVVTKTFVCLPSVDLANQDFADYKQRMLRQRLARPSLHQHRALPFQEHLDLDVDQPFYRTIYGADKKKRRLEGYKMKTIVARKLDENLKPTKSAVTKRRARAFHNEKQPDSSPSSDFSVLSDDNRKNSHQNRTTSVVKRKEKAASKQPSSDDALSLTQPRVKNSFSAAEDDLCVRGAVLSVIFNLKGDYQGQIDWAAVERLFREASPAMTAKKLRRRYTSIRNKANISRLISSLRSEALLAHYNEAVKADRLSPVPMDPGPDFSLLPYIEFSRTIAGRRGTATAAADVSVEQLRESFSTDEPIAQVKSKTNLRGVHLQDFILQTAFDTTDYVTDPAFDPELSHMQGRVRQVAMAERTGENGAELTELVLQGGPDELVQSAFRSLELASALNSSRASENFAGPSPFGDLSERYKVVLNKAADVLRRFEDAADDDASLASKLSNVSERMTFPDTASDALTTAVVESQGASQLQIIQTDAQDDRQKSASLTRYKLRGVESQIVEFEIDLRRTRAYNEGTGAIGPLKDAAPGTTVGPMLWNDVHGAFSEDKYRQAVAVVVQYLLQNGLLTAVRTYGNVNATTANIQVAVKQLCFPQLFAHEVDHCVERLQSLGAISQWGKMLYLNPRFYAVFTIGT